MRQPVAREALAKYSDLVPILDVRTRWSSLFQMIDRFLNLFSEIRRALFDLDELELLENFPKNVLEELRSALRVVHLATMQFGSSDNNLLTCDRIKNFVLSELKANGNQASRDLHDAFKHEFEKRETDFVVLLRYLKDKKVSKGWAVRKIEKLIEALGKRLCEPDDPLENEDCAGQDSASSLDQSSVSVADQSIDIAERFKAFMERTPSPKPSDHQNLSIAISRELNIFRKTDHLGTYLSLLLTNLKAIKGSTTNVKRVFSSAGLVVTKLRTRLSDDLVDKIILLKFFFLIAILFELNHPLQAPVFFTIYCKSIKSI